MPIRFHDDPELVARVQNAIRLKKGHCPCQIAVNSDTKCICRDFHEKMADPAFEGYCLCKLYYKYNRPRKPKGDPS